MNTFIQFFFPSQTVVIANSVCVKFIMTAGRLSGPTIQWIENLEHKINSDVANVIEPSFFQGTSRHCSLKSENICWSKITPWYAASHCVC